MSDKNIEETLNYNHSVGEIVCVESSKKDMQALAVVESGDDDSSYIPEPKEKNS